jgi:hypothetical protein
MRWLTIALAVMALAFAGAGCGGGDDEASTDTDSVTITDSVGTDEETTDEDTTDEETTDDGTDTDVTGFDFSSEECQDLVNASAAFSQAFGSAATGEDLSDEAQAFEEFADNAPEEIRADMQVLAGAYAEIIEALGDVDLDPGAVPNAQQAAELTQALASINQAGVSEAGQRISTWAQENCTTG